MAEEDLAEQVKELNKRIEELESALSQILAPMRHMEKAASGYFRLVGIALKEGGITIDAVMPEIKDHISKEIIMVLFDSNGQNISQITDAVRERRGTASRRIVRERLKSLEESEIIEVKGDKTKKYFLTDKVVRKWAQLLGMNI